MEKSIDDTFNVLRRISFHEMNHNLSEMPDDQFLKMIDDLGIEGFFNTFGWTVDEYNDEFNQWGRNGYK